MTGPDDRNTTGPQAAPTQYRWSSPGGPVLHTDPRFVESVTRVVAEIERTTSAELVVVGVHADGRWQVHVRA